LGNEYTEKKMACVFEGTQTIYNVV